ncbi:MAG: cadherin-like domain-containing protein [Kofleriaceae bacterium]
MRFVALRSNLAPMLLLSVTGCGEVVPENIEAPVNATNAGTVPEGGTLSLAQNLVSADVDNDTDQLVYTIAAAPVRGMLVRDGVPLVADATFTQEEVNDGAVSYVNDGTENTMDQFTWSLSDGLHTIPAEGPATFPITVTPVNDLPLVVNNPISTVPEGGTETLTMDRLLSTDAEGTALTYTFVSISRGQLQKDEGGGFTALVTDATFTQQDVIDGKLRYVDPGTDDAALQAGTNSSAMFNWRVTDADGGVTPPTGANVSTFTITPIDDAPAVNWRTMRCSATTTNIPADPLISLSDPDNVLADYEICVVAISNGTHVTPSTTASPGSTTTVIPTLQNNSTNLAVGSCVAANARSGLNLDTTANENRGAVTWRLRKGGVQVGDDVTVSFPKTPTSC